MTNDARHRGKRHPTLSHKAKEFDPAPFLRNFEFASSLSGIASTPVDDALDFLTTAKFVGKNFCQNFLAAAQNGFDSDNANTQEKSLFLVGKIATVTDDDYIKTQALDMISAQFNNANQAIAAEARTAYAALTEKTETKIITPTPTLKFST